MWLIIEFVSKEFNYFHEFVLSVLSCLLIISDYNIVKLWVFYTGFVNWIGSERVDYMRNISLKLFYESFVALRLKKKTLLSLMWKLFRETNFKYTQSQCVGKYYKTWSQFLPFFRQITKTKVTLFKQRVDITENFWAWSRFILLFYNTVTANRG